MTTFALKIIALLLMLMDHIGEYIPNVPVWFHWLGRLSAPLFLFCVAQGMAYTHDRKAYCKRLYIGAAGMAIGSRLLELLAGRSGEWYISNAIFETLFLVCVIVTIVDTIKTDRKKGLRQLGIFLAMQVVSIAGCAVCFKVLPVQYRAFGSGILSGLLPNVIFCEGSLFVVALGVAMYYLREKKLAFSITYVAFSVLMSGGIAPGLTLYENFFQINYQWMMVFSLPLMLAYNGKRGHSLKWLFYLFYPLHIWALYLIGAWMRGFL